MIAVVRYNAGNICSVINALDRLGESYILTSSESEIRSADRVIFPGVGNAESAMKHLSEVGLDRALSSLTQPFLGICLGMQLLVNRSEEGMTDMLSIIDGECVRFPQNTTCKVPEIGWNTVKRRVDDPLFYGIEDESYLYFVHSYYVKDSKYTIGESEYAGVRFASAIRRDNYYGVQFHPEKSGRVGERLLSNFIREVRC